MTRREVNLRSRVRKRAERAGLEPSETLVNQLSEYVELLRRWNARMNLTRLDDGDAGLDRLVVEPLVAASHLPAAGILRLVDIGSGGGSPAIPLRLATPGLGLLMVEAKTRKAAFLRDACRQLGIDDAVVETERFEALLTWPELHEAHDVLTVRAVRVENRVLRGLQAFVKPGGLVMLFRGGEGRDVPLDLEPPLAWRATYPLVPSLRSRLVILEKRALGHRIGE